MGTRNLTMVVLNGETKNSPIRTMGWIPRRSRTHHIKPLKNLRLKYFQGESCYVKMVDRRRMQSTQ